MSLTTSEKPGRARAAGFQQAKAGTRTFPAAPPSAEVIVAEVFVLLGGGEIVVVDSLSPQPARGLWREVGPGPRRRQERQRRRRRGCFVQRIPVISQAPAASGLRPRARQRRMDIRRHRPGGSRVALDIPPLALRAHKHRTHSRQSRSLQWLAARRGSSHVTVGLRVSAGSVRAVRELS